MEVYKISGYAQSDIELREGGMYQETFRGQFIRYENNEIMGRIEWERENEYPSLTKGHSFIRGLFIDKTKLIFVEITEVKQAKGFCFRDVNEVGYHDYAEEWPGVLFCRKKFWEAYVIIEETDVVDSMVKELEDDFQLFCERLDYWKMYHFETVQQLQDFIS